MELFASRGLRVGAIAISLGLCLAACDDDPPPSGSSSIGGGGGAKKSATEVTDDDGERKVVETIAYRDEDFVESERNRDPFRSYMTNFGLKAPDKIQRRVVMATTTIEAMKLIAIISGTPRPRAMIVDTRGVGHVVERGMYIGRPKVIQATGSISMTLNWRVERIRENEVLLTRQDPVDPGRPPLTRVIPLHEEVAKR